MARLSIEDYDNLLKEVMWGNDSNIIMISDDETPKIVDFFNDLMDGDYYIISLEDGWGIKQRLAINNHIPIEEFEELNKAYQYLRKLNKQN